MQYQEEYFHDFYILMQVKPFLAIGCCFSIDKPNACARLQKFWRVRARSKRAWRARDSVPTFTWLLCVCPPPKKIEVPN